MEKNQLLYVLETARCGSVTRAAEKLHLSQPSLSNQIIQLEQELGIPLFERSHKRVTPTSAGEFFVHEAERILRDMGSLQQQMEEMSNKTRGSLRLGVLSVMCSLHIPELVADFKRRHPGLEIFLREAGSADLLQQLNDNELDAAFVILRSGTAQKDLPTLPLWNAETLIAMPAAWCSETLTSLTLEQLARYPLIIAGNHFNMGQIITSQMDAAGLHYNIISSCNQIDSCLALVSKEMGVTFCAAATASYYAHPNIHLVPFSPSVHRTVSFVYRKDPAYYPVLRLFLEELQAQALHPDTKEGAKKPPHKTDV